MELVRIQSMMELEVEFLWKRVGDVISWWKPCRWILSWGEVSCEFGPIRVDITKDKCLVWYVVVEPG